MILKPYELAKVKNNMDFFLFYGKNDGLKSQLVKELLKENIEESVFRYEEKEILDKKETFFENALSSSLFDNYKIFVINRCSDKIHELILDLFERQIKDLKVVIICELLDKKSKLRKIFEREKKLACIPTYPDTNEILSKLALTFFRNNKISISQQNINLIITKCSGDRINLENELKKIKIYLGEKKKISTEELLKLINLSENHSLSELIDNCLAKNTFKTVNILNDNNFTNEDCILILRTFLHKTKKILNLSIEFEKNKNLEKTISLAKPPIFWKDKEIVKTQLLKRKPENILNLIKDINKTEIQIKQNFNNSILIIHDFILEQCTLSSVSNN